MAVYMRLLVLSFAIVFNAGSLWGDEPYWPQQGAPDYNDEAPQQHQENNPGQNEANAIYRSYEQPGYRDQSSFRPDLHEGDDEGEQEADRIFDSYKR